MVSPGIEKHLDIAYAYATRLELSLLPFSRLWDQTGVFDEGLATITRSAVEWALRSPVDKNRLPCLGPARLAPAFLCGHRTAREWRLLDQSSSSPRAFQFPREG